mmetsp:Transcript_88035/g.142485  ORF Transcript_88035/g.142485 Transcript_88035/m.142485 type:complete len:107 (+) Transcript_88035:94-414(+)
MRKQGLLLAAIMGVVVLAAFAAGALPPGYEDELFCPPGGCLRRKEVKSGMVGPRTLFHECVSMSDSTQGMGAPLPWGSKIDQAIRDKYLTDGYTTTVCKKDERKDL